MQISEFYYKKILRKENDAIPSIKVTLKKSFTMFNIKSFEGYFVIP